MANVPFSSQTPSGGVTVAKDGNHHTILSVGAPANQCVKITHFSVSAQGAVPTDPPIQIRVLRQTVGGTSTTGTSNATSNNAQAPQSVTKNTYTVEPTAGNVIWEGFIHPQLGNGLSLPISEEWIIPGSGQVGIEATVSTATTATSTILNATLLSEE